MRRVLVVTLFLLMLLSSGSGCGGEKAVVPTGPVAAPKDPPKALPMIGPKLPAKPVK
jgi:hypothetical protein